MCLLKDEGGLGVRKVSKVDKACNVINVWNITSKKNYLWVKWIQG